MKTACHLRPAAETDLPALICLFQDTIRHVNAADYTPEQIVVWADRGQDRAGWEARLREQVVLVAEQAGNVLGFASLAPAGYLDLLYVHHAHQRQGVAAQLLAALEQQARSQGVQVLQTDASTTARPFFLRSGFEQTEVREQVLAGIGLRQFRMRKPL